MNRRRFLGFSLAGLFAFFFPKKAAANPTNWRAYLLSHEYTVKYGWFLGEIETPDGSQLKTHRSFGKLERVDRLHFSNKAPDWIFKEPWPVMRDCLPAMPHGYKRKELGVNADPVSRVIEFLVIDHEV